MHSSVRLSTWTLACLLSLPSTHARVVDQLANRLGGLWKRDIQAVCYEDQLYRYVENLSNKQEFCWDWNTSPAAETTTYFTPVTTTTRITGTSTITRRPTSRVHITATVIPTSTVVVTERQAKLKRAPAPTPKARLGKRIFQADEIDAAIQAVQANGTAISSATGVQAELIADISSACSCHGKFWDPISTKTFTQTEAASTFVINGFDDFTYIPTATTTTSTHTTTAPAVTVTTTTIIYAVTSTSALSVSSAVPALPPARFVQPFGLNFSCPKDHQTQQVIVHGTDTFFYRIYCGTEFAGETALWSGGANSHGDCLGACASWNELAALVSCKGTSWNGANCTLYGDADIDTLANSTLRDSAVLESIQGPVRNVTLQNRRIGASQASSVSSVLVSETALQALITPPASITQNVTGYSSCLTTTIFNSADSLSYASWTCSWYYSWYSAWTSSTTMIYSTQRVVRQQGFIGGGAIEGADGGGSGGRPSAGQVASNTASATSTASAGTTGSLIPLSSWASNSTEVIVSTSVAVSGGADSSASSGGIGGLSPLPRPSASSWELNSTSVLASTGVEFTSGATSGGSASGWGSHSPLPPAPSSSWWSNETTIAGTSVSVFESGNATSSASSGGTGGLSPLPLPPFNQSTWIGETAYSTATGSATSSASVGGTGGLSPLPLPSSWSNSTIFESVTTIIEASSTASSWLSTGGTGGLFPFPNATISDVPSASGPGEFAPTGNTTLIVDVITTVSEDGSWSRSRSQGSRDGLQSRPTSGNFTAPFPTETPSLSTDDTPLTTSAPVPPFPGNETIITSSSDDGAWSRSRSNNPREPGSPSSRSGLPSEGFPMPYPNSTHSVSHDVGSTGSIPTYSPTWNASIPKTTPPPTASSFEEVVRSSWLGTLWNGTFSESEFETSSGWAGNSSIPLPTLTSSTPSNGTSTSAPSSTSDCPVTVTVPVTIYSTVTVTSCPSDKPWDNDYGYGKKGDKGGRPPWAPPFDGPARSSPLAGMSLFSPPSFTSSSPSSSPSASQRPPSTAIESPRFRQAGQLATQDQIESSCRTVGTQIFNGEFELLASNPVTGRPVPQGWALFASPSSSATQDVQFLTANSSSQHTLGGRYVARVVLSSKTATARLVQSLTLCPGVRYQFGAWTRQERITAQCEISFYLNGESVGIVAPTFEWSSGIARARTFMASAPEVDLSIDIRCSGSVSANAVGTVELDDLTLERVFP